MSHKNILTNYIGTVIESCRNIDCNNVMEIYDVLKTANNVGGKIYICGNGGSASTASHFQNDLNRAFSLSQGTMPAICLADNLSTLTAVSNDFSYDDIFVRQLKFMLKPSDVLIGISCSGNSVNVFKAFEYAKRHGNTVVSFVGFDGGKLKKISDYTFHVDVDNMQISEDMHLMFCHIISTMIKEKNTND